MRYKNMIENARKLENGEAIVRKSIDCVDEFIERIKDTNPDRYWEFIRGMHEMTYGRHYDADFADYDVEQIYFTDKSGADHQGAHWSRLDVGVMTKGMQFPAGVTEDDIYVAMNVTYADLNRMMQESDIARVAHQFFFADEDWPDESTKIWDYMSAKRSLE